MDEAEQDVLGADVVVVEHPGLFLSQDDNPTRAVGEPLEHWTAPSAPQVQNTDGQAVRFRYTPSPRRDGRTARSSSTLLPQCYGQGRGSNTDRLYVYATRREVGVEYRLNGRDAAVMPG